MFWFTVPIIKERRGRQMNNVVFDPVLSGLKELQNPENTEENLLDSVFIPNWDNEPEEMPAVLKVNQSAILSFQNISSMIAQPGVGKSSVCEAILSCHLNPSADNLGFEGDPNFSGVIYVDYERTNGDVWRSFYRMARRAGVPRGEAIEKVKIAGLRAVSKLSERRKVIESLLEKHPASLLILDGAGDTVNDTNDLDQAIEARNWMRAVTVKYNVSIFTTLHPNPREDKPRGHLGSEICRESETVLLAKNYNGVRILTSDFDYGKVRNGPHVKTAFEWSDNSMMFISANPPADLPEDRVNKRKLDEAFEFPDEVHLSILNKIFSTQPQLTSGNFISAFCSAWKNNKEVRGEMSVTRAKEFREYYIQTGFIIAKPKQKGNRTINEMHEDYKELVK